MNPTDQQNQPQNQPPQVYPAQGAVYADPNLPPQQSMPADPRANFMPAMNPGVVIPGNPNAPIQTKPHVNKNSTQNNLQIAEIRDGIVIMADGSFRSVIMLKSINFDLMSPAEREGVEYSYQGFLNSLYFPLQIFIRSQKIDIKPYLDRLDKIRSEHDNMLLALLMDDYIDYVDQMAAQTNIMDKNFYIVIPFLPKHESEASSKKSNKSLIESMFSIFNTTKTHVVIDEKKLAEAKDELRNRVQAVLGGLLQCGVQGLPLDTQELIELYYDAYNPDTATRQKLNNFDDLQVPIVTKGEGQAPQPGLERQLQ
ncbi:MAG: hypothetical protein ACR2FM_01815 [Candidatus Saccharimonadales bacterium]